MSRSKKPVRRGLNRHNHGERRDAKAAKVAKFKKQDAKWVTSTCIWLEHLHNDSRIIVNPLRIKALRRIANTIQAQEPRP